MSDSAILEDVEILGPAAAPASSPFSWSAAIAGAIAAVAATFIIIALGTGIGLSIASPYGGGPSGASLTLAAAVWLVLAQAIGFACGGYLSARLRARMYDSFGEETTFRDGAQGFVAWALAAFVIGLVSVATGAATLGMMVHATSPAVAFAGGGTGGNQGSAAVASPSAYYVDMLYRPASGQAAGGATVGQAGSAGGAPDETRAQATRILVHSITEGQLGDDDRNYLARSVAQVTGLSPQDAVARVNDVDGKARSAVKQTADEAAKAGAYLSFWMFMSLLFGAVAATLGGILGGELRDAKPAALAGS